MIRPLLLVSVFCIALAPIGRAQLVDPKGPQPELPREDLTVRTRDGTSHVFHLEIARTPEQQTIGLMFRPSVPAEGGMLFDWGEPRDSHMWMRNTLVPLDMLFVGEDGRIRAIAEDTVPRSLAEIDSGGPVRATIELAAGTAARLDVRVGDQVRGGPFVTPP